MNTPQTLGSAQRTFVYDPEQRKVTLMVGLGMLGLAVAFPVLYAIDPEAAGVIALYLSPLTALVGLGSLAHWVYTRGISLTFFEHGFGYRGQGVPYQDIRGIRYKLVHVTGGSASYNKGFLHVRLADGRRVSTSMQLEKMDEVIGTLIGRAMPTLHGGMLQALLSGQSLTFGPFALHPQGVVCRGKSIPWERVAFSSSGSNTHVQLMDVDPDEGDYEVVHKAKLADLENTDALEAVAEEMRSRAIRARH
ncbi:MAG: DUF6585 family protein [Polyangiales bacterium]|nr:hypothetical protein [Myxococcales bacterium]MCB9656625.1 hypothetical protein [Sandaracinaceae bacterium]